MPEVCTLFQNYPNPFNPSTTIRFTLPFVSSVTTIYDLLGQRVKTLTGRSPYPGVIDVPWDGRDDRGYTAASGVYFCRLDATSLTDPAGSVKRLIQIMVVRWHIHFKDASTYRSCYLKVDSGEIVFAAIADCGTTVKNSSPVECHDHKI